MSKALERKLTLDTHPSDDDRIRIGEATGVEKQVPAGSDIALEGDDPQTICVLLDGWAGRCRHFLDGCRRITSLLLPGDSCDPYIFVLSRRDHAITALTHVTVACILSTVFRGLQGHSPALEQAFHRDALVSSAIQPEVAVSLRRRSGLERLAHLFRELHARLTALGLTGAASYKFPLNQNDIADFLGQTTGHIRRMLMASRETDLISLHGRRLIIHDAPRALSDEVVSGSSEESASQQGDRGVIRPNVVGHGSSLSRLAHFDPLYLHSLYAPNGAEFA